MNVPGSLKHSADSADTAELEVSGHRGDGGAGGDDGGAGGAGGNDGEDSDRCGSPGYLPRHGEVGDGSQWFTWSLIMILCRRSPPSHRSHHQNPRHASNSQ